MANKIAAADKIAAFVFGVIFVVVMLYLALYVPNPTETQWFTFRVVLALAAAGVGAVLPGLLTVQATPYVRAGGALALFIVVFWFNPPRLVTKQPEKPSVVIPSLGKPYHVVASVSASGTKVEKQTVPHPIAQGADHHFYIDSEAGNVNSHLDVCPTAESGWELDSDPFPGFANGMTDRDHVVATGDKYWDVGKLPGGCLRIYCDGRNGSSHVQIAQVYVREKRNTHSDACHGPVQKETDIKPGELKQIPLNLTEAKNDCVDATFHGRVELRDGAGQSVLIKDLSIDRREDTLDGFMSFLLNSSGLLDIEYRVQHAGI